MRIRPRRDFADLSKFRQTSTIGSAETNRGSLQADLSLERRTRLGSAHTVREALLDGIYQKQSPVSGGEPSGFVEKLTSENIIDVQKILEVFCERYRVLESIPDSETLGKAAGVAARFLWTLEKHVQQLPSDRVTKKVGKDFDRLLDGWFHTLCTVSDRVQKGSISASQFLTAFASEMQYQYVPEEKKVLQIGPQHTAFYRLMSILCAVPQGQKREEALREDEWFSRFLQQQLSVSVEARRKEYLDNLTITSEQFCVNTSIIQAVAAGYGWNAFCDQMALGLPRLTEERKTVDKQLTVQYMGEKLWKGISHAQDQKKARRTFEAMVFLNIDTPFGIALLADMYLTVAGAVWSAEELQKKPLHWKPASPYVGAVIFMEANDWILDRVRKALGLHRFLSEEEIRKLEHAMHEYLRGMDNRSKIAVMTSEAMTRSGWPDPEKDERSKQEKHQRVFVATLLKSAPEHSIQDDTLRRVLIKSPDQRYHAINVQVRDADLEQRDLFHFPRLSAQQRSELTRYQSVLQAHLQERSQLGMVQKKIPLSTGLVMIEPHPNGETALSYFIEEYHYSISLNSQGMIVKRDIEVKDTMSTSAQDTQMILETILIAAAHDQMVRKVSVGREKENPEAPHTGGVEDKMYSDRDHTDKGPSAKGVHILAQHIVIEAEEDEKEQEEWRVIERPSSGKNTEVVVERFIRPHWVELSPGLVRKAREQALDEWLPHANMSEEEQQLIRRVFLAPNAHLNEVSVLFTALFGVEKQREFLSVYEEAEQQAYQELFARYMGQELIDAVCAGRPLIQFPSEIRDLVNEVVTIACKERFSDQQIHIQESARKGMLLRVLDPEEIAYKKLMEAADAFGRECAKREGVRFALGDAKEIGKRYRMDGDNEDALAFQRPPDRRTPTQTYRIAHVQDHAIVPLNEHGVGRVENRVTVVRATSAVEAVARILGIEVLPSVKEL